jgi:hypothetical protein
MTDVHFARRSLALIALLVSVGCGTANSDGDSEAPRLVELEEALAAGTVLRLGAADGPQAIGAVMAARITPDGSRIVVLDREPPYLKVFRRDGGLEGQYVARGSGPHEMSEVATMAVDNERAFIVGPYALLVTTLDGSVSQRVVPDFPLFDIGTDCAGRVIGYGPRGDAEPQFLHQLAVDSIVAIIRSALQDQRTQQMAWGFGRSSVVRASAGSVINHREDGFSTPVFLSCDGDTTERGWSWAAAEFPSRRDAQRGQELRDGPTAQLTFDATVPINVGAAELPGGRLLWLEQRLMFSGKGEMMGEQLDWFLADSAGVRRGYTSQSYVLQDVGAGLMLFSSDEPWSQVLLVGADAVEQLLARGSWKAR